MVRPIGVSMDVYSRYLQVLLQEVMPENLTHIDNSHQINLTGGSTWASFGDLNYFTFCSFKLHSLPFADLNYGEKLPSTKQGFNIETTSYVDIGGA